MKANLAQNEPQRLKEWDKLDIYNHLQEKTKDSPKKVQDPLPWPLKKIV